MFLIVRDGHSRPARGITFRHFMAARLRGAPPEALGLVVHLTTVFPEVRLKRVVETRGVDAVPGDLVCALPRSGRGSSTTTGRFWPGSSACAAGPIADVDALHARGRPPRAFGARARRPRPRGRPRARRAVPRGPPAARREELPGPGRVDPSGAARAHRGEGASPAQLPRPVERRVGPGDSPADRICPVLSQSHSGRAGRGATEAQLRG